MNLKQLGEFMLDPKTRTICRDGEELFQLNWNTYSVLYEILNEKDLTISHKQLIERVWDGNHHTGGQALTTAIWNLQKCFSNSSVHIDNSTDQQYRLRIDE